MTDAAPGAYQPLRDRWGSFPKLAKRMPEQTLVIADARVARLHPNVWTAAASRARAIVRLTAGERAKNTATLERVLHAGLSLPRSGAVVCIGGGTLGDLATVAAHLIKRGLKLIHVPSTLLAAVDSSVGGKGALHSGGARPIKNAIGVFHYPDECWLCPELFTTLSERQLREGAIEAWKMIACLSAPLWRRYRRARPPLEQLIKDARRLKARVCDEDPYEHEGVRRILNFGHTFGHAIESVTEFHVSHGDAVGLGMLCALDVGRRMGVTSEALAAEIEAGILEGAGILGRAALGQALQQARASQLETILASDKKAGARGELRMVLLAALGRAEVLAVPPELWKALLPAWQRGTLP